MTPNIKKGSVQTAYIRWLVEYHNPQQVVPLEFIGWHYNQNRYSTKNGIPYPFFFRGAKYVGEIWLCQVLSTGEYKTFIFKHLLEVLEDNSETSYRQRTDEVIDIKPNLLLDTYEEFIAGKFQTRRRPNVQLKLENVKFSKRLTKIEEMLTESNGNKKRGLFLILRHKQSPTTLTLSSLKKWQNQYPELNQEILTEVYGHTT